MMNFLKDWAILMVALAPFYFLGESARYLWPVLEQVELWAWLYVYIGFFICKYVGDKVRDKLGYMKDEA